MKLESKTKLELHEDRKEFEHLQQIEDLEPETDEQLS